MRGLQAAVVLMGVLIVLGVGVVGTTIVRRLGAPAAGSVKLVLEEPAGTRMISASTAGDRLALLLQGGGPDRVLLVDPRTGLVSGRIGLAQ